MDRDEENGVSKWGSTIDWVALGEALAFAFALGLVAAVLAALGGALWATRSRRNMRERYEQSRKDIERGTKL